MCNVSVLKGKKLYKTSEIEKKDMMNGSIDMKELLELDVSLHDQASPTLINGTFDTDIDDDDDEEEEEEVDDDDDDDDDDIDYEEDAIYHSHIRTSDETEENREKNMLDFLRGLMTHEQSAKHDMIKVLNDHISILKQELTHKQTIIDSLLGSYYRVCNHTNVLNTQSINPSNFNTAIYENVHHQPISETLLDVKTIIEEQMYMSRSQARVECDVPHKICRIRLKPQKPVSQILSEIKDLMEAHITPTTENRRFGPTQKVYRIRFNPAGNAFVSCVDSDEQIVNGIDEDRVKFNDDVPTY